MVVDDTFLGNNLEEDLLEQEVSVAEALISAGEKALNKKNSSTQISRRISSTTLNTQNSSSNSASTSTDPALDEYPTVDADISLQFKVLYSHVKEPREKLKSIGKETEEERSTYYAEYQEDCSSEEIVYEEYEYLDPVFEYLLEANKIPHHSNKDQNLPNETSQFLAHEVPENYLQLQKSKGRYVTPTMLQVHHSQAKTKNQNGLKDLFIKNGKGGKTKIKKDTYYLDDTSIIDTISEIFSFCYKFLKDFTLFCDSQSCDCPKDLCFIEAIKNLSKAKNLESFYTKRATLLLNHGKLVVDKISCDDYCGDFYSKLLNRHFMIIEKISCSECHAVYEFRRSVLKSFSGTENCSFDQSKFESQIKKRLFMRRFCQECNSIVSNDHILDNYMALDIEHTKWSIF